MPKYTTLDRLNLKGKSVLVRCDLNVPIQDGKITDTSRIDRVAPTLIELMDQGARVVVMSHLGRPQKREESLSLAPLQQVLSDCLYGAPVAFVDTCIGPKAKAAVESLSDGGLLLLENLRFESGEEDNDPAFAAALSELGEYYVNDAFATAHRAHASVDALPRLMPVKIIGRLMQAEIEALNKALGCPERPLMAIVGGAKVSSKLDLLHSLIQKTDKLVVGGGMANTLLLASGVEIGMSLCERDMLETAKDILSVAQKFGCEIILPSDLIMAPSPKDGKLAHRYIIDQVPSDQMILDVGPTTCRLIKAHLKECKTLIWNGPLGFFEVSPFDTATQEIAHYAARLTQSGELLSVAGGGDTVAALSDAGVVSDFSYVSTAGGAFLEWLEGRELPGIKALEQPDPEGLHCPLGF